MAKRARPAQGRNSTKRIVKTRAGGELIHRSVNSRRFKNKRRAT